MPHLIERAATGRAKCRGCGGAVGKGEWRVGETVPNLYAEAEGAESRYWYHVPCAAYRRPEAFLQAVESAAETIDDREALVAAAQQAVVHHRVARVDRVGRAPSGRAACRECRTPIDKNAWRIGLVFWQDGRFSPAGFIHLSCARAYFGTVDILDRVRHFTSDLTTADIDEVARALGTDVPPAPTAPASTGAPGPAEHGRSSASEKAKR